MLQVEAVDEVLVVHVVPEHRHDRGGVEEEHEGVGYQQKRADAAVLHVRPDADDGEKDGDPQNDDEGERTKTILPMHLIDTRIVSDRIHLNSPPLSSPYSRAALLP